MTDQTGATDRTAFTRKPDRGSHDLAEARAVLAEALIGHVGTVDASGSPVVLPVAIALDPDADRVLFHGSTGAGMFRRLAGGGARVPDGHAPRRAGHRAQRVRVEHELPHPWSCSGTCEVLDGD